MINNSESSKIRIRTSQELSLQMEGLIELKKIMNSLLKNWFLSGGTLLGVYRDGDFIPWDWDVEVTVLSEEAIIKEGELLKSLVLAGFTITNLDSTKENFKIDAKGWGTSYEIVGRYLKNNNTIRARSMTEVPSKFFQSTEIVTFRGHDFPAPSPTDKFLEAMYGDWKKPKKTVDKNQYYSKSAHKKHLLLNYIAKLTRIFKLILPDEIKEFPNFSKSHIQRFQTWDKDLGWCNLPNHTKLDRSDRLLKYQKIPSGLAVINTDKKGSRQCFYPSGKSEISFYGDSYIMCRDVQDNETIPWYLGEIRKTRVANYGVGNYGLDQALLRLKRDYQHERSEIVILAGVSITMARCCSVYRHYLEPGNFFALKPRFKVNKDNQELELIKYPFKEKEEIIKLKKYKKFFRSNDEHFDLWHKNKLNYYFYNLPRKIIKKFGINLPQKPFKTLEYELSFWQKQQDLFFKMMMFFQKLADQNNFKPIFLIQHQKRSLEYLKNKSSDQLEWTSVINKSKEKFPKITFLDEAEIFNKHENIEELYTRSHHSPKANLMITEFINKNL